MLDLNFISNLEIGDLVEARFTNVAGWRRFPAKIVKINKNTVRVVRNDGLSVWENDNPDREFVIVKIGSVDNGIFPIVEEMLKKIESHLRRFERKYPVILRVYHRRNAYFLNIIDSSDATTELKRLTATSPQRLLNALNHALAIFPFSE